MPFPFTKPKLIVCEGKTDKRFFDALLGARGIPEFDVYYPATDDDNSGGIDKVGRHLHTIGLQEDFIQNVRSIVVAGDNDDADAFDRVCRQVEDAGYVRPTQAEQITSTHEKPDLAILLLPQQPPGCFESLCRQAAQTKWPGLTTPLDTYMNTIPAIGWTASTGWAATKQSISAIECILAVTCESDPEVQLGNIWQKNGKFHIPLDVSEFDYIETFLRSI